MSRATPPPVSLLPNGREREAEENARRTLEDARAAAASAIRVSQLGCGACRGRRGSCPSKSVPGTLGASPPHTHLRAALTEKWSLRCSLLLLLSLQIRLCFYIFSGSPQNPSGFPLVRAQRVKPRSEFEPCVWGCLGCACEYVSIFSEIFVNINSIFFSLLCCQDTTPGGSISKTNLP